MSTIFALKWVHKVTLIERNNKIDRKLYITGKGRFNVTNKETIGDFFENVLKNEEFLCIIIYFYK